MSPSQDPEAPAGKYFRRLSMTAWPPPVDSRPEIRNMSLTGSIPDQKLNRAGQRYLRFAQHRVMARWRWLQSRCGKQRLTSSVFATMLILLMVLSGCVLRTALLNRGGRPGSWPSSSRKMLGAEAQSHLGSGSSSAGGGIGGGNGPTLVAADEVVPGFYVRNLTDSWLNPAAAAGRSRPSLVLRYEACGGLFNQYYCHLNAFAMGIALGVDGIIMPHAKRRRKYTASETVWEATRAETLWDMSAIRRYAAGKNISVAVVPTYLPNYVVDGFGGFNPFGLRRRAVVNFPHMGSELFRMETFVKSALRRVAAHREFMISGPTVRSQTGLRWREVGGLFTADNQPRAPSWARLVDPSYSRAAWALGRETPDIRWAQDWRLSGKNASWVEGAQVWELFGQFLANETFASEMNINLSPVNESAIKHLPSNPHIKDNFKKPVDLAGQKLYRLDPAPQRVLLNLPCVMHTLQSIDSPLMTEVALNWGFAPHAQQLADKIIVGMAKASGATSMEDFRFDGVHLRLEADASRWIVANGGLSKTWESYLKACMKAGINGSVPIFVASGIFSAMNPQHEEGLRRISAGSGGKADIFKASDFLSEADLQGLHSEARSLVDFLVVLQSQNFVGVDASTFSVAVQQQRQLWGIRGGGKEVMVYIKGLPDFHQEMMRLGSTFSRFPGATAQS